MSMTPVLRRVLAVAILAVTLVAAYGLRHAPPLTPFSAL